MSRKSFGSVVEEMDGDGCGKQKNRDWMRLRSVIKKVDILFYSHFQISQHFAFVLVFPMNSLCEVLYHHVALILLMFSLLNKKILGAIRDRYFANYWLFFSDLKKTEANNSF